MKNEESLYLGLAVVIALIFMVSFFVPQVAPLISSNTRSNTSELGLERETSDFYSNRYNFGFTYFSGQGGYTIVRQEEISDSDASAIFILAPVGDSQVLSSLSNSAIKVEVYEHVATTLVKWAEDTESSEFSNRNNDYQLGRIVERDALWYQTGGGTATDNLAIRHGDTVLLFKVQYQSLNDVVRLDFLDLLRSIRFQNI